MASEGAPNHSASKVTLGWPERTQGAPGGAFDIDPIERYGDALFGNRLVYGDNLALLRLLQAQKIEVDLVYIDPPFATGDSFRDDHGVAFCDQWPGGIGGFLAMMLPRLELIRSVLSSRGSLLLHCDYRSSHLLGVLCDEVFGPGDRGPKARQPGFRNEIVWAYGLGGSSPHCYPKKHDTILWYSKSGDWYFQPPMVPAESERMKGLLKKATDCWDIPSINNMAHERTGYPTQKPEALLRRVIEAHSRKGDLVADFFCGSATTLCLANRMGRRWLGCDQSPAAVHAARKRLLLESAPFTVERVRSEEAPDTQPPFEPRLVLRPNGVQVVVPALVDIDFWAVDWDYRGVFAPSFTAIKRRGIKSLPTETPIRSVNETRRVAIKAFTTRGREMFVLLEPPTQVDGSFNSR